MTNDAADPDWYLMRDIRRRAMAGAVWVPLRQSETVRHEGEQGKVGEVEEIVCTGAVAFYPQYRGLAEKLGWSDLGLMHSGAPYAFRDGRYKPTEAYWHNEKTVAGVELIYEQRFNMDHANRWIINPDLTIALGLMGEGDSWVCVDEGYVEVIRSRRDSDGREVAIEIKSDFLRDYLAARGLALRVAQYRQRMAILNDASHIPWSTEPLREGTQPSQFEAQVFEVDETGSPYEGGVAVFEARRTDVDHGADVPHFGPESSSNTESRSFSFQRRGPKFYRVEGELWREEWIEPATKSIRVRGDEADENFHYTIDATGQRVPGSKLNFEEVGRYLWFRPTVMAELLRFRGGVIGWSTRQTGGVKCSPSYATDFGVNRLGLINVYAYDIAKLPHWQQRIWSGHNVAPDGEVSSELLDAQHSCRPAKTTAPERDFQRLYVALNERFAERFGGALFRNHASVEQILLQLYRFRGIDQQGVFALAKDIARVTADSIDVSVLRPIVSAPSNEKWGTLKHLQKVLETIVGPDAAKNALTGLVGIYELRLADAHLPSSKLVDAYGLIGMYEGMPPADQAMAVMDSAVASLTSVLTAVESAQVRAPGNQRYESR